MIYQSLRLVFPIPAAVILRLETMRTHFVCSAHRPASTTGQLFPPDASAQSKLLSLRDQGAQQHLSLVPPQPYLIYAIPEHGALAANVTVPPCSRSCSAPPPSRQILSGINISSFQTPCPTLKFLKILLKKSLQSYLNYDRIPEHYAWECGFSAWCPTQVGLAAEMMPPEE